MQHDMNQVIFHYDGEADAFPPVDPGVRPFGSRVLVQVRRAKTTTKGGIILAAEARDTEAWNTQVAKVIGLGPLAYKNRNTMEPWPEGSWCDVGEYVRVPRYGGDRWSVKTDDGEDEAILVIFNDLDLVGKVTGDPMAIKAFL